MRATRIAMTPWGAKLLRRGSRRGKTKSSKPRGGLRRRACYANADLEMIEKPFFAFFQGFADRALVNVKDRRHR